MHRQGLQHGCKGMELNLLYGMVVKGTRARGWLWAAPLIRALEHGRSCVLITSLNPASGDFQLVLRHVPGAIVLQTAIEDGRLALLLPTGDNSVNLYRRGARRGFHAPALRAERHRTSGSKHR